jgi:hypothetical protein
MTNGIFCLIGYTAAKKGNINMIDVPKLKKGKYFPKVKKGIFNFNSINLMCFLIFLVR